MPSTLKQYVLDRQKSCQEGYEAFTKMGAWDGFYKTLSSLYPDNAHFVYELLQNAEDAKASKVKFELLDGSLIFKHNGSKDFSEKDIESMKATVAKAEIVTEKVTGFEARIVNVKREVEDLWSALDYISNPLK